jgi:DNA-directed RNA polymerase omega subunit
MNYEAIEDLLPKAGGSIYTLVRMASGRALELAEGKKRLVESEKTDKDTTVALKEIAQGKIIWKEATEAVEAMEVAQKAEVELVKSEESEEPEEAIV